MSTEKNNGNTLVLFEEIAYYEGCDGTNGEYLFSDFCCKTLENNTVDQSASVLTHKFQNAILVLLRGFCFKINVGTTRLEHIYVSKYTGNDHAFITVHIGSQNRS